MLTQIRKAFTSDIKKNKIIVLNLFPVAEIYNNIKKDISVGDEFIEGLLYAQKDDQYSFSILSLLYPHLDYRNNNFHKDHIHSLSKYADLDSDLKVKYEWHIFNSIYNLQMLDANENMSKGGIY